MLRSLDDLLGLIGRLYPDNPPRPFLLVQGVKRVKAGEDAGQVAGSVRSTRKRLEALAVAADPLVELFGCGLVSAAEVEAMRRPQGMIGQLLLGELAERAFESIYKQTMGTDELTLEDDRSSRNETDYRVLNGQRRPVFRINIKFYGTLFRNARDLVGLEPEDCFALATYKIYQGLQKHESERLPYVFVIVGVPGLTGASVGAAVPEDLVHLVSLVHAAKGVPGKRAIEERVVASLIDSEQPEPFRTELTRFREEIEAADWYALSARRADRLLRDKLFDRVYAVRVRAFARNYRNADALLADAGPHSAEDLSGEREGAGPPRSRGGPRARRALRRQGRALRGLRGRRRRRATPAASWRNFCRRKNPAARRGESERGSRSSDPNKRAVVGWR